MVAYDISERVLVTVNEGKKWEAAEVVKVGKTTSAKDTVERYRVKLLDGGNAVKPIFDPLCIKQWTGENIVRYRVNPNRLEGSITFLNEMFLLAVRLRNLKAAQHLHKKVKSDNNTSSFDSKKLLLELIKSEQASMIANFEDDKQEATMVKELSAMLTWLKTQFKITYNDYTDNQERTPEHVAALRGDLVLLSYIINMVKPELHPLDEFNTAPFMYASRKGHIQLLHMYLQAIVGKRQIWTKEHLEQTNKMGDDCFALAKNDETKAMLLNIQNAIEGNPVFVAERLSPSDYEAKMRSQDEEFKKLLRDGRDYPTVNAISNVAEKQKNEAQAYLDVNPTLEATNEVLKQELVFFHESILAQEKYEVLLVELVALNQVASVEWMLKFIPKIDMDAVTSTAVELDKLDIFQLVQKYQPSDDSLHFAVMELSKNIVAYILRKKIFNEYEINDGQQMMEYCITGYSDCEGKCSEDRTEILKLLDKHVHGITDYQALLRQAIDMLRRRGENDDVPQPIPESTVVWFIEEKGCDLLSEVNYPLSDYKAPWFEALYNKHLEARILAQKTHLSLKVQPLVRGFLTRQRVHKEHADFGMWSDLILKMRHLRTNENFPESFGKTWAELKLEYNYISQASEFDLYEDEALATEGAEDTLEELEEGEGVEGDIVGGKPGDAAVVCNILLTSEALKWLRVQKDEKYRTLFFNRIDQLARGGESYCLSKRLKGSKHGALETKLDKGQRIIWTQRGNDRMIWFICKHDKISRCCELIDLSYSRVVENTPLEQHTFFGETKSDEPEMLANPIANVPLKIHVVETDGLHRLVQDKNWTPPLQLTANEDEIVARDGTVLLLGRSGTGKTLCVCNRMAKDRAVYGNNIRQLFVSRTTRLCEYVEALQKRAGENMASVAMRRIDDFVDEISRDLHRDKQWPEKRFIGYDRFKDNIWKDIKGKEKELNALQVWTQFRTFIKGSYEATSMQHPLTLEDYLKLGADRCRLRPEQRRRAYAFFETYQRILEDKGWFDEVDRVCFVYSALLASFREEGMVPLYDRIYVDEIQDITQAEIALLFLAAGNNYDAMFFAGDTAQTVSQGVDFRFEEIRSIVYALSQGKRRLERPEKLTRNFRSHNGILQVSNLVLNCLHTAFPAAASKLPPDTGLVLGPRPGLITMNYSEIAEIVTSNTRLRVLVRDESKARIQEEIGQGKDSCIGIRDAKGLEFRDVVILDFFSDIKSNKSLQRAWKDLVIPKKDEIPDVPLSMELELKLLYTAITRSCDRLFFIETKQSQAYDAWCRKLSDSKLAKQINSDVLGERGVMTTDDWMIEGIDVASQVSDSNYEEAATLLGRAMDNFRKANLKSYEQKCRANMEALELMEEANLFASDPVSSMEKANQKKGAQAIAAYLDAGMVNEAARFCRRLCSSSSLSNFMVQEISNLRDRAQVLQQDSKD